MLPMRFAISIPQFYPDGEFDPAAFGAYFTRAEELGFDSAWAQEQVLGSGPQLGPVETMTYAVACTRRLRLGCAVFVSTLHSPVHLAKSLSTLDQLSRGRIDIGVGTGGLGRPFAAFPRPQAGRGGRPDRDRAAEPGRGRRGPWCRGRRSARRGPRQGRRGRRGTHAHRLACRGADRRARRLPAAAPALHRLVQPHGAQPRRPVRLLSNVVWTNHGPCPVDGFEATRLRLRAARARSPCTASTSSRGWSTTWCRAAYASPTPTASGSARTSASGTTVMHEGFVNFNAGTLGTSMVEGRITAGVVVGDGSDIGGGSSIMGTLSGGGKQVITIGERCLLGANAGIGISLGDDCVVEAGLYVTAGTKVTLPDGRIVKARDLSGSAGLLFIRNSVTGGVEVRERNGIGIALNSMLHSN